MYGLVNQAIRDLILEQGGAELWRRVRTRSSVAHDEFVRMEAYEDSITFAMVGGAASELGLTVDDVLRAFGRYWIGWVERNGYGPLLDLGRTYEDQLYGLDALHARLARSYPEFRGPSFLCEPLDDHGWRVTYRSTRAGLLPMVLGMLEGLAVRHEERVVVTSHGDGRFDVVRA